MTRTETSAAWPEGVIARYLTVGGATVDLTEHDDAEYPAASATGAKCTGCTSQRGFDWWRQAGRHCDGTYRELQDRERAETDARTWAQEHAEKCRAMPRPEAGSR